MFDTYNRQETQYVPYAKTVHEYKAPTDDSIKLYGEFLEKARKELVERGKVTSNEVNVSFNIYRDNLKGTTCCYYALIINGRLVEDKFEICYQYYDDRYGFFMELKDHIIKAIASHVVFTIANTDPGNQPI